MGIAALPLKGFVMTGAAGIPVRADPNSSLIILSILQGKALG
jgi:hypothetical protein